MQSIPQKQIAEVLKTSHNVLIALPNTPTTDAVSASLGLYLALEKIGKKVRVVCSEFELPPHHQFLPKSKEIHSGLAALRKFVITLDTTRAPVQELSYDIMGDKLNIFVTPKSGFFEARDVSTSVSEFEYDLIFTIDAPDLESLGKLFEDNAEFFYHTPVVNIDHKSSNEQFGQVNFVDLIATSSSEIVFHLLKEIGENIMDEYIATSLLTGIISKTKSFQTASVTPRSLLIASHLIEQGARRDDIIKNLYRTKSIATLKLWGRMLARLRTDFDGRVVWSILNLQDFERSGAKEEDTSGVIDELIVNMPHAELIVLVYEKADGTISAIANSTKSINGLSLFSGFQPTGSANYTVFSLGTTTLPEAEQRVIETVRTFYHHVA